MPREFRVRREQILPATPEQVWHAVTTSEGNLGWLYPMDVEPRLGGAVSRGSATVVAWEPPYRFACRTADQGGFTNVLSYTVEEHGERREHGEHEGGAARLSMGIHWTHTGTVDDGWDTRADAAERHVDFYQHSLAEYLRHFAGRPAAYVKATRPAPPTAPDAFAAVRERLGVPKAATAGDRVKVTLAHLPEEPVEAVVDFTDTAFLGLRTADALYRFYDGTPWNWPIWLGHHLFSTAPDTERATRDWEAWLAEAAP
ncbi:Activator of Hsp90 ATPase 1 family protein [Actinobacteria bacterium OK074]|nr:Activator of Hsp90 ATPase 1 family protein [Actinobacteria bacterium OK074]